MNHLAQCSTHALIYVIFKDDREEGMKGKTNEYCYATWMHGHKFCNVYLGSCKKLVRE
jgi:hypothetical protein